MSGSETNVPGLLGSAIKTRRQELGFSQEELAWRAGLNRTYLTDVERGARNLSLSTIDRLASALKISLSTLLERVDLARGHVVAFNPVSNPSKQVDILLVEDSPRDAEMTLRALRRARLCNTIDLARDGAEAIEYLFGKDGDADSFPQKNPDLILLDLRLPRLDGLEVLRRVKKGQRTRSIPVVVLTASEGAADFAEARRLGASDYIVKPVSLDRLGKIVGNLNLSWSLVRVPPLSSILVTMSLRIGGLFAPLA